jgi:hypothetical protein
VVRYPRMRVVAWTGGLLFALACVLAFITMRLLTWSGEDE